MVVQQVPRGHKESKGRRESVENLALVQVVPQVLWGQRASVVRWGSKVRREIQAHQVHKESVAAMVSRVTKELQAPWVAPGCVVPRETVECKVQRVTQVSKDQKATREMLAFVDLRARLV